MARTKRSKVIRWIKQPENSLMIFMIISVATAIILAFPVRAAQPTPRTIELIRFPGDLFFNLLKMCVLPVVIFSILSGVTSMDLRTSGKLGGIALLYYLSTTLLASLVGVTMVNIIRPGDMAKKTEISREAPRKLVSPTDSILDFFRNMFTDNIFRATIQRASTVMMNTSTDSENNTYVISRERTYSDDSNYIGVIFFCVFFGAVLVTFRDRAKPIIQSIALLNDVFMRMMMAVAMLSPIGVLFLILGTLAGFPNIDEIMSSMGMMALTTLSSMMIISFIVYPLLYFVLVRRNPFTVIYKTVSATSYAFLVGSSSATLPFTLRCCEEKLGINKAVTRFMLPIGAVINMDGTCAHECAAALFIAQLNGIQLGFGEMMLVSFVGAITSISTATMPGSAIISLLIVLTATGLPTEDVGLFFMTDWLMGRLRTSVNILGDAFACSAVASICAKDIASDCGAGGFGGNGDAQLQMEPIDEIGDDRNGYAAMAKMV